MAAYLSQWTTTGDCSAPNGGYGFAGYLGWSGKVGSQILAQLKINLHDNLTTCVVWETYDFLECQGRATVIDPTGRRVPLILGEVRCCFEDRDHNQTMKLMSAFDHWDRDIWARINLPEQKLQLLRRELDDFVTVADYAIEIDW